MGRGAAWVIGAGFTLLFLATPASAQVRVDVSVLVPPIGVRVGVGAPPVYVVDPFYAPVYTPRDRHWGPDRRWGRASRQREYHKDVLEARREYEKDRREAEREYWKDRREAEREHWKDVREAQREYEKNRREGRLRF